MLTDEEILDAYIATRSYHKAAQKLVTSTSNVNARLSTMKFHGVNVPSLGVSHRPTRFVPERVAELNERIKQKLQEADIRKA